MSGFKKLKGNKKVKIHIDPLDENLSRYRMHDGKIGYLLMENEETVIITLAPNSNDDMILPPKEIQLPKINVEEVNDVVEHIILTAVLRAISEIEDKKEKKMSMQQFYSLATESTAEGVLARLCSMGYDQSTIIELLKITLRGIPTMVDPAILGLGSQQLK